MRTPPRLRRLAVAASALYAVALAFIAFWPTPVDKPVERPIRRAVDWSQSHGAEVVTYPFIESMANVALFVPVGLLLVLIFGARRWWLAVLIGAALSVTIEIGQLLFLSARFSTVNDVVANTAGTIVGAVAGVALVLGIHLASTRRQRAADAEIPLPLPRDAGRADAGTRVR